MSTLLKKLSSRHNWRGLMGLLMNCANPAETVLRYYFHIGTYPACVFLRTPIGRIALDLYSREDLITVHEVFFRRDYGITGKRAGRLRVAVDFGANIGVAAAYFATRNRQVQVYSYEPVPTNVARARKNLEKFQDRVEINDCAVGLEEGMVGFGIEPSGRYGGIGIQRTAQIEVPCRRGEAELERIVRSHRHVDVLKVDIEGMESVILNSIKAENLDTVDNIFAECDCTEVTLPGFRCDQNLSIATFRRK
jgi:FkbM family methyltransferase